jgi:hypothetical protein
MNSQPFDSTLQVEYLTELVKARTEVAGDIVQIGLTTWAIHGSIPVDGEVLVAEYDSLESAKAAIAQLPPNVVTDGQAHHGHLGAMDRSMAVPALRDPAPVSTCPNRRVGLSQYFLGRTSATWRAALQPRARLTGCP